MKDTGFSEITYDRLLYNGKDPWYIEIALTGRCNFSCLYCNRFKAEASYDVIREYFSTFSSCKHVQLTGGEPTLHKDFEKIIRCIRSKSKKIGLSTNGTYGTDKYLNLGIDMFSISLDDYDTDILQKRGYKNPDKIIETIVELSKHHYVNVGMVVDSINIGRVEKIIDFILSLGVDDIKLSTSTKDEMPLVFKNEYPTHPILNYRVENFKKGYRMRGNPPEKCHIVKHDVTIVGDYHYPCLVYFREGGAPIAKVSENIMKERLQWFEKHNAQNDSICKEYCMDFKCEFNRNVKRNYYRR